MGIGLIGKAAGDQQTHRLTNQSPAVLVCAKYLGAYSKSLQHRQQFLLPKSKKCYILTTVVVVDNELKPFTHASEGLIPLPLPEAVVNGFFHFYGFRRKSLSGMTSYKRQELSICKASWRQGKGSTGRAGLQQFWLASYPGQKHPPPGA